MNISKRTLAIFWRCLEIESSSSPRSMSYHVAEAIRRLMTKKEIDRFYPPEEWFDAEWSKTLGELDRVGKPNKKNKKRQKMRNENV